MYKKIYDKETKNEADDTKKVKEKNKYNRKYCSATKYRSSKR